MPNIYPPAPIFGIAYSVCFKNPAATEYNGVKIIYDTDDISAPIELFPPNPEFDINGSFRVVRYAELPPEFHSIAVAVPPDGSSGTAFSRAAINNLSIVPTSADIWSLTSGSATGCILAPGGGDNNSVLVQGSLSSSGTPLFGIYVGEVGSIPKLSMLVSSTYDIITNYRMHRYGVIQHNGIYDPPTLFRVCIAKYVDEIPPGLKLALTYYAEPDNDLTTLSVGRETLNSSPKYDTVLEEGQNAYVLDHDFYSVNIKVLGDLTYSPHVYTPSLTGAIGKLRNKHSSIPEISNKSIAGIAAAASSVNIEVTNLSLKGCMDAIDAGPVSPFTTDANGTITDYNADVGGLDVIIPSSIDGMVVTVIGLNAFKDKGITSVVIPEGVEATAVGAFDGNMLTEVTFPSTFKICTGESFINNPNLSSITFNSHVQLGANCFGTSPITRIDTAGPITHSATSPFGLYSDDFSATLGAYNGAVGLYTHKYGVWTYGEAFLEPGTYTWNSGRYTSANVIIVGGGGGGASGGHSTSCGGGHGGKGAHYNLLGDYTLQLNTDYSIVVGVGGSGGVSSYDGGLPGGAGGASSFRTTVANGGSGGVVGSNVAIRGGGGGGAVCLYTTAQVTGFPANSDSGGNGGSVASTTIPGGSGGGGAAFQSNSPGVAGTPGTLGGDGGSGASINYYATDGSRCKFGTLYSTADTSSQVSGFNGGCGGLPGGGGGGGSADNSTGGGGHGGVGGNGAVIVRVGGLGFHIPGDEVRIYPAT